MFKIQETVFQLTLDCTTHTVAPSEQAIVNGRQASTGYFWGGVARYIITLSANNLDGIKLSPENGMFEATSCDKDKLEKLRDLMLPLFQDAVRMRYLIEFSGLVFEAYYFDSLDTLDRNLYELG